MVSETSESPDFQIPRLPLDKSRRRTMELFIDCAIEVFGRDGYRAARMEDIADLAGKSRTTLYTYFRGRNELVLAIRHRLRPESYEIYERLARLPELTHEEVRRWVGDVADFFQRRRVEFAISMEALSEPALHDSLQADLEESVSVLQATMAAARRPGSAPTTARVQILLSQLLYTMHLVKIQQVFADPDAVMDELAAVWLAELLDSASPRSTQG